MRNKRNLFTLIIHCDIEEDNRLQSRKTREERKKEKKSKKRKVEDKKEKLIFEII